jgi:Uma2 family endonuclease
MSSELLRKSVDEYLKQYETVVRPQELVWGYVRDAPSPAVPHQDAVLRFAMAWHDHVEPRALGRVIVAPMDCVLDKVRALVVQPDLLFVSAARDDIVSDRVWGAPDLVLEVLSPRPRLGTLEERLGWFAAYGVKECWLYDESMRELEMVRFANAAVAVRHTFDFQDRIVSRVFPDFDRSCASILTVYRRR